MHPHAGLLAGRVAVVVGTSPNIGAGIARVLAEAGAAVACVDRSALNAEHAAADAATTGALTLAVATNAVDEDEARECLRRVERELGVADVLVNAVAVYQYGGVLDLDVDAWRSQVRLILDSAFIFTQHVCRRLVEAGRRGSVVNLVSTAGHQGEAENIAYGTAKAGLLNFTRSAAMELAPHRIRVNSVTPTATDPSEWQARARAWDVSGPDEELLRAVRRNEELIPLGRLPAPRDYGNAIAFLASDLAENITGVDLPVDGGALARYWRAEPREGERA